MDCLDSSEIPFANPFTSTPRAADNWTMWNAAFYTEGYCWTSTPLWCSVRITKSALILSSKPEKTICPSLWFFAQLAASVSQDGRFTFAKSEVSDDPSPFSALRLGPRTGASMSLMREAKFVSPDEDDMSRRLQNKAMEKQRTTSLQVGRKRARIQRSKQKRTKVQRESCPKTTSERE